MTELLLKGECKSGLRQVMDQLLNISFPFWGIISPYLVAVLFAAIMSAHQSHESHKISEYAGYLSIVSAYCIGSLLLKRLFSSDAFSLNKDGVRLPHFVGMRFHFHNYLRWDEIGLISATIGHDQQTSRITITTKKGKTVTLPTTHLQTAFVEQFILAARMWCGNQCDESLARLQEVLKASHASEESSYTELWEEELSRRFCPTSYIPLAVGKALRNNTLTVVSHLSSGGLSALYLCQLSGKQLVVLKEAMTPEGGEDSLKEKAKEMFDREAKLLMKVDHKGIVRVIDCFTEADRNYLVMEYVNGIDLRQMVTQNGPQRESDVLDWSVQIAASLKYLHERETPIVHRDLTPDNIVLRNDGSTIIVDFGAANELIGTATGTFVGKHAYIAPEQLRGKATIQSDIYAFGCTLFFLLTGREPMALSPSNPRELQPHVSEELAELIECCTQLEGSDRYTSIGQLLPVLRRLSAQSLVV